MKAWIVREWCKPEGMSLEQAPMPSPGPRQVVVKIAAAALNFLDTLMIQGLYQVKPPLPFTPGVELSGVVEKAGEQSAFRAGERVCGTVEHGAFAEYCVADDAMLARVPAPAGSAQALPIDLAAAVPIVYGTAHLALQRRGALQAGETLLVHAGAGGVGLAAIQLGLHWGAKVIATAGGAEKVALCKAHGAHLAIDYSSGDWVDRVKEYTKGYGANMIFDPVGGDITDRSLRCIAWEGRLLIIGFAGGRIAEIPANRLLLKNAAAVGVFWGGHKRVNPALMQAVAADVMLLWSQGRIAPVASKRYALADAPQALNDLASRRTHGKVLLVP